jgi:multidrug efflux pump
MATRRQLPADVLGFRELSFDAIRRWRLVLVGACGLFALGALAWLSIPRLDEPRIDVPAMTVGLAYPGASPEDVETQIVKPLEEVLFELDGATSVESSAYPSLAIFVVRFEERVNMDVMAERARGKLIGKRSELPAEAKEPEVVAWSSGLTPQMVVAVTGHASDDVLSTEARRLKAALATIPGVAGSTLVGEHKPAIRVRLDPARLARHGLSAETVVRQLRLVNVRVPGGEYDVGPLSTILEVNQEFTDAASVARVPVAASLARDGSTTTVLLADVAEVRDETLTPRRRFAFGTQPAVGLEVRFRRGTDAVAVGDQVRARLDEVRATLPPEMAVRVCHDQPEWVRRSVRGFVKSLLEGMLLVLLVITLGMGLREALVVAGVIPLSVGGAVLGLYLLGFSLESITIGGLIVALGLLVDDAVVVTESVQILRDKGLSALRASVFGTARVFWANNGTTAVAISSFLPLFAMGGDTGKYIKGMPTAVTLALATSLLVAQLFTPWIATLVSKRQSDAAPIGDEVPWDRREDRLVGTRAERNPVLRSLRVAYTTAIPRVVRHPGRVILAALLLLGLSLSLFRVIGFQFFPKTNKPVLFVSLELPKGTRVEKASEKLVEATEIITKDAAVRDTSATIGMAYPEIFTSRMGQHGARDLADVLVRLREGEDPGTVAPRLRRSLADLVGVRVSVEELAYGPPVAHPIIVRIFGHDYAELRTIAAEVKERLAAVPGAVNVADSLTDSVPLTRVRLDVDRAIRTGVTPAQVGQTLRYLHGEDQITEFRRGEDQVEVILDQLDEPERPLAALGDTLVPSAAGTLVPLKDAGQVSLGHGFARLSRRNAQRVVEVNADLEAGALTSNVLRELDPWLRSRPWKPGYGFTYGGEQEEIEKSFRMLGIAAVGAVLLIFLLLLLMFDSILLAVLVMLAVPFALLGALPGLALTGNPFGFMAFLGLIALIGVYVNHKIYFVDRMLELLRRGDSLEEAILHAGQDRLRPVVLTAMTAVLGLVPLTLEGGRMWGSFGWVNIFGLVASIPLSLVLLPAFIAFAYRVTGRTARFPGGQHQ